MKKLLQKTLIKSKQIKNALDAIIAGGIDYTGRR